MIYSGILEYIITNDSDTWLINERNSLTRYKKLKCTSGEGLVGLSAFSALEVKMSGGDFMLIKRF